eukprot:UN0301
MTMHLAHLLVLGLPVTVLGTLFFQTAEQAATQQPSPPPISDFCWGDLTLFGKNIKSSGSVKGAIVLNRDQTGAWDWKQHEVDFGDMMNYHVAGIQPEEVVPLMKARNPLILLTAGVVGVLNLSDLARKAIVDEGYELLDVAKDNAKAKATGADVFHAHCKAGSVGIDNLSQRVLQGLHAVVLNVQLGRPVVVRAYTGDALIIANEMHEQFPHMEFSGLIHTNC